MMMVKRRLTMANVKLANSIKRGMMLRLMLILPSFVTCRNVIDHAKLTMEMKMEKPRLVKLIVDGFFKS